MSNPQHAIIVGGGIAGPALALFLKKAGITSLVYEAHASRAEIGGALGLAPNGMNVLDELGLADAVEAAGSVFDSFDFRDRNGNGIGAISIGRPGEYGRSAVALSRARLHEIVTGAAEAEGIPIAYGKRLVAIDDDGDRVIARFADGTEATGDFLVGADGINSRVREIMLPDGPKPAFTGIVGPGGFVPRSAIPVRHATDARAMVFYFGAGAFFGYGFGDPGEDDGAFWWTAFERDRPLSDAERAAVSLADVRAELMEAGAGWNDTVRGIIDATTRFVPPLDIFDVATLPRWWSGHVVLMGDAAHAVSPHSGQGASMALEDAICLARQLRDAPSLERAFVGFEAERRERVEKVVAYGRRSGDTKKKPGPVAAWFQRILMPLFIRFSARNLRWVNGYRIRWDDEAESGRREAA